jgi:hypothetical protein
MVTDDDINRYLEILNGIDFSIDPETKWHELIADLLIEIKIKLEYIENQLI